MKRFMKLLAALLVVTLCMSSFAMVAFASQKVTATGNCNVRKGPGLYYSSRGTLYKGEKATYMDVKKRDDRGVYWLKIKFNGSTGWVSTKYARVGNYASNKPEYDDDDDYTGRKVKATGSVNVRTGPGTGYKKLGTIYAGTTLKYRGKMSTDYNGHAWFAVIYKGKKAWVSSLYSYLK